MQKDWQKQSLTSPLTTLTMEALTFLAKHFENCKCFKEKNSVIAKHIMHIKRLCDKSTFLSLRRWTFRKLTTQDEDEAIEHCHEHHDDLQIPVEEIFPSVPNRCDYFLEFFDNHSWFILMVVLPKVLLRNRNNKMNINMENNLLEPFKFKFESLSTRRAETVIPVWRPAGLRPMKAEKTKYPRSKVIRQKEFPASQESQIFSYSVFWLMDEFTHFRKRNLFYSVYWSKC